MSQYNEYFITLFKCKLASEQIDKEHTELKRDLTVRDQR